MYLRRFFTDAPFDCTFLIDEAHNLVDRSREIFSAQLVKSSFLKLRRVTGKKHSEVYESAGRMNSLLLDWKRRCGEEGGFFWENDVPEETLPSLRDLLIKMERLLKKKPSFAGNPAYLDLYFEAFRFLKVADRFDEDYLTYCESKKADLTLKLFCVDPSSQMREALTRAQSAVFFSATLSPVEYYCRLLGCGHGVEASVYPSPFPPENLLVTAADSVSTYFKHRGRTKEAVALLIGTLAGSRPGNYLAFFPSYLYMKMVNSAYEGLFPHHRVAVQSAGLSEAEREAFLGRFTSENHGTLVGFAVMGGIFGEGIDLLGDRLSGAVIVGVGMPPPSPERELIRAHFSDYDQDGFDFAYVYPGMTRVLQAVGRVIRSETDRGAVLLIDRRYSLPHYSELFPREWEVTNVRGADDLTERLREFWPAGGERGGSS